jgi:formylglycine-generating enzyme required for sulfatase activity
MMKRRAHGLVVLAILVGATAHADPIAHDGTVINMDFVTIGDPGNAKDTHGDGYGAVDYVYDIGTYEVTQNQWSTVVAADTSGLLEDPGRWSGNQPVAVISWHDAAMFCNWLTSGNVTQGAYTIDGSGVVTGIDRNTAASTYGAFYAIPTENEWYKAAYYDPGKPGYWDYPTKHDDPNVPDGIDSAADTAFDAVFSDGYNHGRPNDVDNAGVLSAYGTMGQGGNVWEWNETAIGSMRGTRGGDWVGNSDDLHASTRFRSVNPGASASYLGFRVARVPEPGSFALSLAALGIMGSFYWWRRRPGE